MKQKYRKRIISLALASEGNSYDTVIEFNNVKIRVSHFSLNFNYQLAQELIQKYDGKCDAIAVSGLAPVVSTSGRPVIHPKTRELIACAKETPILMGSLFKSIYLPWSLRDAIFKDSKLISKKNVSFYSGASFHALVEVIEEGADTVLLADLYTYFRIPLLLKNIGQIKKTASLLRPIINSKNITKKVVASFVEKDVKSLPSISGFLDSHVFIGNQLHFQSVDLEHLRGKTVIIDCLSEELKIKLLKAGVVKIVSLMNYPEELPFCSFALMEALIQCQLPVGDFIGDEEVLNWIEKLNLSAKTFIDQKNLEKLPRKFAFIIHPLSSKDLLKHPLLRPASSLLSRVESTLEDIGGLAPGFFYGKISGIQGHSSSFPVEGLIYSLTKTPRKLLEANPEKIYKELVKICEDAHQKGAEVIGLGAYTKIVGDAGLTVAQRSPIPVTTGNSLSACSTLWAAKYAIEKMGLVASENQRYRGTAMVIGATGAIGAVCAKILAQYWENIVICAPRAYKLLELKKEIKAHFPKSNILVSTKADEFLDRSDLIITSTSAQGRKILDISKVRPGAVICDVSRPFDIPLSDALSRPDVMVIASGEVTLPGEVNINLDMGLVGNAVYACLAETALLAMAGRMESFTLSRNISFEKVHEIDRLAKDHGVKLASIMGHSGVVTDREFDLCRQHALIAKEKLSVYQENLQAQQSIGFDQRPLL